MGRYDMKERLEILGEKCTYLRVELMATVVHLISFTQISIETNDVSLAGLARTLFGTRRRRREILPGS